MEKEYYTVGEVSKLCDIPVRTLHYYDEIGLLNPAKKDGDTGYRYYGKSQLLHVNIIKQFKVQGYNIKEIKERLANHSASVSREALQQKLSEIKEDIEGLILLKKRLEYYLNALNYQDHQPHIHAQIIPPVKVLSIRKKGAADPVGFMKRFAGLETLLKKEKCNAAGPVMAVYYDDYHVYDPLNADIEVCVPVQEDVEESDHIRDFGNVEVVSAIHYGAYCKEYQTYGIMMEWMEKEGYEMCGNAIEKYLIDPVLTEHEEEFITELMIPVRKKA